MNEEKKTSFGIGTVLVVDDEPEVLATLRRQLRREFTVYTAENAQQALEILDTHPVQAIISDQRMPDMSGSEFLARAKEEHPDVLRILLTGYADLQAVIEAVNSGEIFRYVTKPWDPVEIRSLVREACERCRLVLENRRLAVALQDANAALEKRKEQLERENVYLRQEIGPKHDYQDIVGKSAAIGRVLRLAEQVAALDATVLVTGETGTGKELMARAIHEHSGRRGRTMVKVNCAALPSSLIDAELFGREKGAYTGALSRQIGRFELADGSTLFLDEIGELSPALQAKLLRVLQEGQFERLGSSETHSVDVRIIAATNRDLAKMIEQGKFREDLYYRLNVFPIEVPPLRERREDIPALVWSFVKELGESMGKSIERISAGDMEALTLAPWPGNIRELRNLMERSLILCEGTTLKLEQPRYPASADANALTLDEVQRRHILVVLERTHWRIRGQGGAAQQLGLKPTTLEARLKKLGLERPDK